MVDKKKNECIIKNILKPIDIPSIQLNVELNPLNKPGVG